MSLECCDFEGRGLNGKTDEVSTTEDGITAPSEALSRTDVPRLELLRRISLLELVCIVLSTSFRWIFSSREKRIEMTATMATSPWATGLLAMTRSLHGPCGGTTSSRRSLECLRRATARVYVRVLIAAPPHVVQRGTAALLSLSRPALALLTTHDPGIPHGQRAHQDHLRK